MENAESFLFPFSSGMYDEFAFPLKQETCVPADRLPIERKGSGTSLSKDGGGVAVGGGVGGMSSSSRGGVADFTSSLDACSHSVGGHSAGVPGVVRSEMTRGGGGVGDAGSVGDAGKVDVGAASTAEEKTASSSAGSEDEVDENNLFAVGEEDEKEDNSKEIDGED